MRALGVGTCSSEEDIHVCPTMGIHLGVLFGHVSG